jgi:hypothetical protein
MSQKEKRCYFFIFSSPPAAAAEKLHDLGVFFSFETAYDISLLITVCASIIQSLQPILERYKVQV